MIKNIIDKNTEVKPNSKKLEALREYFAGCFTAEGAFDIERFKDMMIMPSQRIRIVRTSISVVIISMH